MDTIDRRLVSALGAIGASPRETADQRIERALAVLCAVLITPFGVVWGSVYWIAGVPAAASIPYAYAGLTGLGVGYLALTRDFAVFRTSQLLMFTFFPFLLMYVLGGFSGSGGVILWTLIGPLGATVFADPRRASRWFLLYLGLVGLSGVLEIVAPRPSPLEPELVIAFFVMNIAGVSLVSFVLLLTSALQHGSALGLVKQLFGRYVSPEVAQTLLTDPVRAELGGEVVEVTILFADLQGYTPFSEESRPDDVVAFLNRYFGIAAPIVSEEGGTVVQFIGDAMMAMFNAPVRYPDHAVRAARASLRLQAAIGRLAADRPDWPRFRIGINSGPTLVGNVGSDELRNFTAIGDTTNTAARLQTMAEPGSVVISGLTCALIGARARTRPLGTLLVKGKERPIEAFVLEGLDDKTQQLPSTPTGAR